jgi:hypothetical protein
MATATADVKHDTTLDHSKTEDVAEKRSNSSAELEAQHVELDEAESARVLRKVDMRLVPMLALLYLVAFIDRSNSMFGLFWPYRCNKQTANTEKSETRRLRE